MVSCLNKTATSIRVRASYIAYKTCDRVREMIQSIRNKTCRKERTFEPSFGVLSEPFQLLLDPSMASLDGPPQDSGIATPTSASSRRVTRFQEALGDDE